MCELLAMSAGSPATLDGSMAELARHGGETGPHVDGWGIGFVQDGDAFVLRDADAACRSPWLALLQERRPRGEIVVAHIRRATQGRPHLRNSQPFGRELGGRVHLFAHNGMLPGIEREPTHRFRRVGDTDSEHAFCVLLERLAPLWEEGMPPLAQRLDVIETFARDLRGFGPANFVYTDGDAVFAHAHRRRGNDGEIRPPGLHLLCRHCAGDGDVALVASVPLSAEAWRPLDEGTVIVLRGGRVVPSAERLFGQV